MQSYRAMTSLGSQRYSGLTHMTRVLRWMHPGLLGRTCQDDDGELPFLEKITQNAQRQVMKQSGAAS